MKRTLISIKETPTKEQKGGRQLTPPRAKRPGIAMLSRVSLILLTILKILQDIVPNIM